MNVIHLSVECYPVAKIGGLGDVVGALPKYLNAAGVTASVVMPYYKNKFVAENNFTLIYEASLKLADRTFSFQILKETTDTLGFSLYLVRIPDLLDREKVYGYTDETEQFTAYQLAVLEWINESIEKPDIIHCHDYHAGLVPFLMYHCSRFSRLSHIPTVLTIHNAEYQGWMGWDKFHYLPDVDSWKTGLLDWNGCINPLAAGIKCCWKYTTVSPSYLEELSFNSNGLEYLFAGEKQKAYGIINGIDTEVWDPEKDATIERNYSIETLKNKQENKRWLTKEFGLTLNKPLIAFIGRLVLEKGADLLAEIIDQSLVQLQGKVNFLVLGSGEPTIEAQLKELLYKYKKNFNLYIGYNEQLSHRIYAGADFLLMPSRVEPCGLNQLYSLRYGTMPIVRSTGGLKDTVVDIQESEEGYGIRFDNLNAGEAVEAIRRAVELYANTAQLQLLRKRMMSLNFSWNQSANQYIQLYNSIIPNEF